MSRIPPLLIAVAILITGCYSESSLSKDGAIPDDVTAYFYLRDGTHVKSAPGQHARVDGGYRVAGEIFVPAGRGNKFEVGSTYRAFTGRIQDGDLMEVTQENFDWLKTTVAIAIPLAVLVYAGINFNIGPAF